MRSAVRKPMTMAEFLVWEERQEFKHEFDGIQPVAMAGGTFAHAALQRNLAISIGGALRGTQDGRARGTGEPVVVFEVLSPSTAATDRIVKAREYQATASVMGYVIFEQSQVAATLFARTASGWSGQVVAAGEFLDMPEIGVSVALDDLYEGIDLASPEPE